MVTGGADELLRGYVINPGLWATSGGAEVIDGDADAADQLVSEGKDELPVLISCGSLVRSGSSGGGSSGRRADRCTVLSFNPRGDLLAASGLGAGGKAVEVRFNEKYSTSLP